MNAPNPCVLPLEEVTAPATLLLFKGGELLAGAGDFSWPLELVAKRLPGSRLAVPPRQFPAMP